MLGVRVIAYDSEGSSLPCRRDAPATSSEVATYKCPTKILTIPS